jgi:Xaa-Pro dipeptidase
LDPVDHVDLATLTRLYARHLEDLSRSYDEILKTAGLDAVVIHSGSLRLRTVYDDQYWPLRATPHFQHWVPLAQPDCALVVAAGKPPVLVWPHATSIWETPARPETEHFVEAGALLAIERPSTHETIASRIKELAGPGKVAFVGEDAAAGVAWGLGDRMNPPDLVGPLDRLRSKKTAYEVLCLAEANRRAGLGHLAVLEAFRTKDRSELDLHLEFLRATAQDDWETPYKNIVAIGQSAAVLHHVDYKKRATSRDPESLLVDAGAAYQGYCSDVTRTWLKGNLAASATLSAFGAIVSGVEAMQQRLCAAVKVGAGYEKLHEESHRQVADILREVGIVNTSTEETVAKGITRAFYPHGLGHSLGLQCHDVGCALIKPKPENPYLRNTSTITPDQCFTVEPGIYFIEGLLGPLRESSAASAVDFRLVAELAGLGGVRIEDDLVVLDESSPDAIRNLTREHLPVGGGPV